MEAKLIAVQDVAGDQTSGSIVFWRLSPLRVRALAAAWEERALDPALLPPAPTPIVALRRAVEDFTRESSGFARPIKDGGRPGFVVVGEKYGDDGRPRYSNGVEFRWVEEDGSITMDPFDPAMVSAFARSFATHLDRHNHTDLSAWLVRVTASLHAVRLRDSGGIYFLPRPMIAKWSAITDALSSVSASRFFEIPALRSEEAAEAILDSLAAEADGVIEKLTTDFAETASTERGRASRLEKLGKLSGKLSAYERLLGRSLTELHARLTEAELLVTETELIGGAS